MQTCDERQQLLSVVVVSLYGAIGFALPAPLCAARTLSCLGSASEGGRTCALLSHH